MDEPEYIITDRNMAPRLSEEYQKALIEKYGHTELHTTVDDDMDDFGEYDKPTCDDPECFMCD